MVGYDYDKKMGERIRTLRERQGLRQEDLCAKLNVAGWDISRSGLAKIEVGARHIYAIEIKTFKNVLNVPYEELFV